MRAKDCSVVLLICNVYKNECECKCEYMCNCVNRGSVICMCNCLSRSCIICRSVC